MSYFMKVIPPMKRARVHRGECRHCRNGKGQEHQDKGKGPTFWSNPFSDLTAAQSYMAGLGYTNTGLCAYCKPGVDG